MVDHRVDGVLQREDLAAGVDLDLLREVAAGDRGGHLGDVAHLIGQVGGHEVHRVREVAPGTGNARNPGLTAESSVATDLAGDPRDLVGERRELVDHRVDRRLELQHLAGYLDRDLRAEVALRHCLGHSRDVAYLVGEVGGHEVHRVGEVAPGTGDTGDHGLTAEPTFRPDLPGDPGDLLCEERQLVEEIVDGGAQAVELTLSVGFAHGATSAGAWHPNGEVPVGDRGEHPAELGDRSLQVVDHVVHRADAQCPPAALAVEGDAFAGLAVETGDLVQSDELASK